VPARRPAALSVIGGVTAALLLVPATAQAVSTPTPVTVAPALIDIDTAFAAMPAAKSLPGAVRLTLKIQTPGSAGLVPCPETLVPMTLKGSLVGAEYETANKKTPADKTAQWSISAVVFHTTKLAASETAKVVKAEKACPKKAPNDAADDNPFPFVRTKAASYSVDGWKGYRTVDQISVTDLLEGPDPVGERINVVYLTKGNVMLAIQEEAGIQPGTTARQDAWRKTVTALVLKAFDALS
jgi:hypothetical protein